MTIGRSPAATSRSAARMPAGPAPTTTKRSLVTTALPCAPACRASASPSSPRSRAHLHAGHQHRGAGAQALAALELHPAVLAGAHQAEAGAWRGTEVAFAQALALGEDGGEHGVAFERGAGAAVEREGDLVARRAACDALEDWLAQCCPTSTLSSP